ncbi:hypothetical protein EV646_113146 [Kribbella antiqua]|uniref:DUF4386 domain-containing protein n=1 Tax=Kribbella antiqua TaxID=2512217 RepID=A0A4R2ID71_9ACTN|nr:hypothetical protein [Kribbella antiqua]TCO42524.1 hypothetical protein EV646_113146 [Kribbella antiqua]
MTSTIATTSGARHADAAHPSQGKGWVYAGVGAGVAGIATIVGSSLAGAVYDPKLAGNAAAITEKLADQTVPILVMHTAAMVSAVLLLVFAAGLRRRLVDATPQGSLLPPVAASGLMLVSVALLMGSALTTEFVFGVQKPDQLVPETAVFFGHWIGTVPWLWVGAGIAAIALGLAGRKFHAVPPWLAWTSLVLGGLTTLLGVSPLQYMAGMTGPLWLTIAALGLLKKN